jgi:mono/diheme cytochrome c family protein
MRVDAGDGRLLAPQAVAIAATESVPSNGRTRCRIVTEVMRAVNFHHVQRGQAAVSIPRSRRSAAIGSSRMTRLAMAALVALVLAGCGGSRGSPNTSPTTPTSTTLAGASGAAHKITALPNQLLVLPPHSLRGAARAEFLAGRATAAEAGCLACHMIGSAGNHGPGPTLTSIGSQLDREQLLESLRSPAPPMPSFAQLSRRQLLDLVRFLQELR